MIILILTFFHYYVYYICNLDYVQYLYSCMYFIERYENKLKLKKLKIFHFHFIGKFRDRSGWDLFIFMKRVVPKLEIYKHNKIVSSPLDNCLSFSIAIVGTNSPSQDCSGTS